MKNSNARSGRAEYSCSSFRSSCSWCLEVGTKLEFKFYIGLILEYDIKLSQDYAQFHFNQSISIPQLNKATSVEHISSYDTPQHLHLLLVTDQNQALLIKINQEQFQILDLNPQVSSISRLFYKPQPFTQHPQSAGFYSQDNLFLIAQFTANIHLAYYQNSQLIFKQQIPIKHSNQCSLLPGSILITSPTEINFLYSELYSDGYIVKLLKAYLDSNYTITNIVEIELHRDELEQPSTFRSTLLSFNNHLHAIFHINDQSYYLHGDDQFVTNSINSVVLGFGILQSEHSQHLQLALPDKIVQLTSQVKPLNEKVVKGLEKDIYERINAIYENSEQPVMEFRLKVEGVYNAENIGATINLISNEILEEQSRTILLSISVQSSKDVIRQELERKLEKLEKWRTFIEECCSEVIQKYCLGYLSECMNKTSLALHIREYQMGYEEEIRRVLREWSYMENEEIEHFYTRLNYMGDIMKVTRVESLMLVYLESPFELESLAQWIIDYCKHSTGNRLIDLLTCLMSVMARFQLPSSLVDQVIEIYLKFNLVQDLLAILEKYGFFRQILELYFKGIPIVDKVDQILREQPEQASYFVERSVHYEKSRLAGKQNWFRLSQVVDDFKERQCMEGIVQAFHPYPHLQFHVLGSLKRIPQASSVGQHLSVRVSHQESFLVRNAQLIRQEFENLKANCHKLHTHC